MISITFTRPSKGKCRRIPIGIAVVLNTRERFSFWRSFSFLSPFLLQNPISQHSLASLGRRAVCALV
jgi:hypothetical protein